MLQVTGGLVEVSNPSTILECIYPVTQNSCSLSGLYCSVYIGRCNIHVTMAYGTLLTTPPVVSTIMAPLIHPQTLHVCVLHVIDKLQMLRVTGYTRGC